MAKFTHDIIIVGGGAAGLTATVGCAQLGLKTLLIDREKLGGDCLYYGCVPSKSLIKSATVYQHARDFSHFGLPEHELPPVEMPKVNERVQNVIQTIAKHDSPERFEKLGAEVRLRPVRFLSPHELRIDDSETVSAKKIVLATGSGPRFVPIPGLAEAGYITNKEVFSLPRRPDHLLVIGSGPIGTEMSQAFLRLGARVTVFDLAGQMLPKEDADMAEIVSKRVSAEGADLRLGVKIKEVRSRDGRKIIVLETDDGGEEEIAGDEILLSAGRQGNSEGLDIEKAGVEAERSFFKVNDKLQTSQKHIYAAGDCNGKFLFTHVAGAEGSMVVRKAALHAPGKMSYESVPWCTYTDPELASIGYNETRAKQAGIDYKVYTEAFHGNDRALAEGESEGLVKVLTDKRDRVIGMQIAALHAGDLLLPGLFAQSERWKVSRLMNPIYPYPTMGETEKRLGSNVMAPKLFNDKVRGLLKFFFGYRGTAGHDFG